MPDSRFISLGTPERIWALSAIHGEQQRLMRLHDTLYDHIRPGDRLVYLGNYGGYGDRPRETMDEILTFRRMILARPGMLESDLIYLRGTQEEMWQKLLQLQFAPDPVNVLLWMLGNGLSPTLTAYGISPHDGIMAAREGVMSLTRWTNRIRHAVRRLPGHEIFGTHLRRAAYTQEKAACQMLFVHAGIDTARPLRDQGDNFWWSGNDFNNISLPYDPFHKVIRGFDPGHRGININGVTATIDGGCGFGGGLVCAGFDQDGALFEMLEA